MRKRSKNRKLKIMICLLIFLIIIAILGIYFYYDFRNKKIYEEMNIQFIENKVIEYGDNDATSKKLVKNVKGAILKYPEIDVMKVGKQKLLYQLEDNKITKEIQTEIEIKDPNRPEIILKKSKITLPYGADFNMASNIKQVKDVVDGNIPYNENKEKSAEGGIHTMSDALNTIIVRETEKAKILTLIDLVEDGSLSIEKAAEKAGMTVKQLKELMDKAPLQTV